MSVLSKQDINSFKWIAERAMGVGDLGEKTNATNYLNLIDTIDDRDKQVDDLQAKLEKAMTLIRTFTVGHDREPFGHKLPIEDKCPCKWCETLKSIEATDEN